MALLRPIPQPFYLISPLAVGCRPHAPHLAFTLPLIRDLDDEDFSQFRSLCSYPLRNILEETSSWWVVDDVTLSRVVKVEVEVGWSGV